MIARRWWKARGVRVRVYTTLSTVTHSFMSEQRRGLLVLAALTATLLGSMGYFYRKQLHFQLTASAEAHKLMNKLNKIKGAQAILDAEVQRFRLKVEAARGGRLDDLSVRELKQLNNDTDYLFEQLDSIPGSNEYVKSNRKTLVLLLRENASSIDDMMAVSKLDEK